MKQILIGLLFVFHCIFTKGQDHQFLSSEGQECLYEIYHSPNNTPAFLLQNTMGQSDIEKEYLHLYHLFIAYQASENPSLAESFNEALDRFEDEHNESDRFPIMHSTLLIQQSLLYWSNEAFTKGIRSFYKSYRQFCNVKSSTYSTQYFKLDGIFQVFFSQIPDQYQFWARLIGFDGKANKGFQLLNNTIQSSVNHKGEYIEALVLYNYCQLKFKEVNDDDIRQQISKVTLYDSPLLSFVVASLAIKNKLGNEGLLFLNQYDESKLNDFPLLHYSKGRLLLNALDSTCLNHFQRFQDNYHGHSFKSDALLREAWWYHINHNDIQRNKRIQLIRKNEKFPTSNDKQARKEINTLQNLPGILLRARLLYDGGYFQQAFNELSDTNTTKFNAYYLPEYHYRKAKTQLRIEQLENALSGFEQVLSLTADDKRYIGPYSAIECAKIHLQYFNDTAQCRKYLEIAKEYNTGEYQKDINRIVSKLSKEL